MRSSFARQAEFDRSFVDNPVAEYGSNKRVGL
jgi:hypothetical protein